MRISIPQRKYLLFLTVLFALLLVLYLAADRQTLHDTLSYSTRPLWDRPEDPRQLLPHYTAEGVPANDEAACKRHGWSVAPQRQLVDAILFSTEVELLEIRLRELWNVVDVFVIVESTHDLMGQQKVSWREAARRGEYAWF